MGLQHQLWHQDVMMPQLAILFIYINDHIMLWVVLTKYGKFVVDTSEGAFMYTFISKMIYVIDIITSLGVYNFCHFTGASHTQAHARHMPSGLAVPQLTSLFWVPNKLVQK